MKSFAKIASLALVIGLALTLIWTTSTTKAQEIEASSPTSETQIESPGGRSLVPEKFLTFKAEDIWQPVVSDSVRSRNRLAIDSDKFLVYRFSTATAESILRDAPMEFSEDARGREFVFQLPMPNGKFESFRVVESPILSDELQAQYPDWRTYQAYGIDDPTATARFGITLNGFHASVFSSNGTVVIDPITIGDTQNYIVYSKNDLTNTREFHCLLDETIGGHGEALSFSEAPQFSHGTQIRTYRLAIAATGEYTSVFGGQAQGLAAVTTTANRMNGIYRKDFAVGLQLVSGTNLVYANAGTDPYTNVIDGTQLDVNQTNINTVIGSANYDVGHLFATSNNGLAQLSSICGAGKARGASGQPNPQGDGFDVDYVAHEIGHQIGANHTFNSDANCGSGSSAARKEPGSGVTIMSYAGICSSTANLQRNSIEIFLGHSQQEAISFLSGAGGTCGTLSGGNAVPVVTGPGSSFSIPFNTPYSLTATATDANSDPLTYSWEHDTASGGSTSSYPGTTDDDDVNLGTSRILMRAYLPTASGTRTFPSLTYILNNSNEAPVTYTGTSATGSVCAATCITGEDLPSVARTINYRVTVRDNQGGVADAITSVAFVNTTTPFKVTTQNTASTWTGNTNQTVTWDVSGSNGGAINTANVKISLSTDGGQTFPTTILASTANDGSESITVPNTPTTTARIKVEAVGNIFFDINDVNFTIVAGGGTPTPTNTPTATPTNTPTATPTNTPTATPTSTPTATPTVAPTATPTNTPTATPTVAPTATPTNTPTATPTIAPTSTPTATPTATPTPSSNRVVRVVPVIGSPGGTIVVPVSIDSLGNEAGMGLSISFNTAILTYQSVALGSGAPPNSTLTPNTNEVAQGRVGVLFDSLNSISVSPPAREVFLFTFAVAANAPIGPTQIALVNSPIVRSVSDAFGNTLNDVSYVDGAVTIATPGSTGFEADIAPRPNGDNAINVTDVIQLRRFVTLLDTVTPGELQRADAAPRATFGDGNLSAGDVIQVRRYATTLDPLTPAGGPVARAALPEAVSSIIDDVYAYFFGRELRVGTAKIDGSQVIVPIELTSFGDELAASFTLEYDTTRLSNPRIVLGDGAPEGSVLTINTNDAGRIAVLVDGTAAAASGPRSLVYITFDVASEGNGVSEIKFTDMMAPRSVSGANGDSLSTRYVDGSIGMTE